MSLVNSILKPRVSWVSAVLMIAATVMGTVAMLSGHQTVFGGKQGYPFAWNWWSNIPDYVKGYSWVAFIADVVIWMFVILGVGVGVHYLNRLRLFAVTILGFITLLFWTFWQGVHALPSDAGWEEFTALGGNALAIAFIAGLGLHTLRCEAAKRGGTKQ